VDIGRQGYLYLSRGMNWRIRLAANLNNLRLRTWLSHGLSKLKGSILRVDLYKLLWARILSSSLGSRYHCRLMKDLVGASLQERLS
jgi:hypothetical protein